jgi:hypothetical protein
MTDTPIAPERIYHHARGRHNRLWFRVSWAINFAEVAKYVAMSLLLDTGTPKHMYLSKPGDVRTGKQQTRARRRRHGHSVRDTRGSEVPGRADPAMHAPANLIGLKRLGLRLQEDHPHFSFETGVRVFGADSFHLSNRLHISNVSKHTVCCLPSCTDAPPPSHFIHRTSGSVHRSRSWSHGTLARASTMFSSCRVSARRTCNDGRLWTGMAMPPMP